MKISFGVTRMDNTGFLVEMYYIKEKKTEQSDCGGIAGLFGGNKEEVVKRFYAEDSNCVGMYITQCVNDVVTGVINGRT